jgi:phage gp16-like protein
MNDRSAMIAKVHVAKKQLALDDGSYRAVLKRMTGQESAANCTDGQLERLLKEFKRLGFVNAPARNRTTSEKPWVRKVLALWADLAPLLDQATDETLRVFVARQTKSARNPAGISRPEWLTSEDATPVIQGLEGWLARERAKVKP